MNLLIKLFGKKNETSCCVIEIKEVKQDEQACCKHDREKETKATNTEIKSTQCC